MRVKVLVRYQTTPDPLSETKRWRSHINLRFNSDHASLVRRQTGCYCLYAGSPCRDENFDLESTTILSIAYRIITYRMNVNII